MQDIKKPSQDKSNDSASPASKPPAIKFVDESEVDDDNSLPIQNVDVIEEEESKEDHT